MVSPRLQNPFVGLRPYESSDTLFYFGRNEQTKTLLRLLHNHRFVTIVGSSGAGKSSLVRAGLIPQLEAGFLVQDRDQWIIAATKPGDAPLSNLIHSLLDALKVDTGSESGIEKRLQLIDAIEENGTQALFQHLKPISKGGDTSLFVLVDQFEELFRFGLGKGQSEKRQQAEQFIALLLSMSRHDLPIYICLTMRSDFLGDCDAFYGLPEAINKSQFLVPRLTRSQREDVITHPVYLAGAEISPRLVDKLLNESVDTRDDLPVLQHTLMRTWNSWQSTSNHADPLDIEHYENIHTIHKALNRHADEAFKELNRAQRHIAKILFQALTAVDGDNRRIRRPVHLTEVSAITNSSPEAVMEVIKCFCEKNRSFLVLSSQAINQNPLIDISHESLIRQWKKLDEWVEEENEAAETYKRLVATSQRYSDKKAGLLYDIELKQALKWQKQLPKEESAKIWAKRYNDNYTEAENFLRLSESAHIKKLANEKIIHEQELQSKIFKEKAALEEQKRILAEEQSAVQKRALIKTRWLSALMAMLTIFMLGVAWFALEAKKFAQESREIVEQTSKREKKKALEANYNLARAYEEKSLSSILRGDALLKEDRFSPKAKHEYRNTLLYALEAQQRLVSKDKSGVLRTTLSRASSLSDSILATERFKIPESTLGILSSIAFSQDGKIIASGTENGSINLSNTGTGETTHSLQSDGGAKTVSTIAISSSGKSMASASLDTKDKSYTIQLWDTQSHKIIKILKGHTSPPLTLAFSPDGRFVASGFENNNIRIWNVQSGETIKIMRGHSDAVFALAYSPDGRFIASGSGDKTIRIWSTRSGETTNTLKGHSDAIRTLAYSPNGKFIATGSQDTTIKLWSTESLEEIKTLEGHTESIRTLAFSFDGKVIASGSRDESIRLWDLNSGKTINTLIGHTGIVFALSFSTNDESIVSASYDNTIRFWNTQIDETINTFKGSDYIRTLAYNPEGNSIASGSEDGIIQLWDPKSGEIIKVLKEHSGIVKTLAYSPDGKTIASGSEDNTIRIWDIQTGKTIFVLEGHSAPIGIIVFSPDGQVLASGSQDKTIRLWNVKSGSLIKTFKGVPHNVSALAYSPNGEVIASSSSDNTIRLLSVPFGNTVKVLTGHSSTISTLKYSPDGEVIASASRDNTIRLWDAQSGKNTKTLKGHIETIYDLAYSNDGKTIVSASRDNTIRIWNTQTGKTTNIMTGYNFSQKNSDLNRKEFSRNIYSLAYSSNDKIIVSASSEDPTIRLWRLDSFLYRFVYDFDATEVSGALQFLWGLEHEGLNFKSRSQSLAWTDKPRMYLPLIDMPKKGETKMDQLVRWLEKSCAYKRPELYGCTPETKTKANAN